MWVIEGAFDQPGAINLEQKKLKLLKPGRSYPLGRKPKHSLQLVLNHPKISGEHVTFVVGEHVVDSVSDPTFRPTLKVHNHRSKPLQVSRRTGGTETRHFFQPSSEDEVLPGDCIALVTGIYISIHWRPVCCYLSPKSPTISFEKCASLGVKVVSTPRPEVTHHLTATLRASTSLAISLLNHAHIVRHEWLTELLHLGETVITAGGPSVLESEFRLPAEAQYMPKVDSTLPAPLKPSAIWEPNDRRAGIFNGWRFLFVGEKGREVDTETRTLVERGGGEYEVFDVSGGLTRWRQSLSRNERKAADGGRGLSVVADTDALKLAAGDTWDGMLEELSKVGLQFVSRSHLLDAVLFVDASRVYSSVIIQTEKDSVLNTHEDEPASPASPSHSAEVPISAANAIRKGPIPPPHPAPPTSIDQTENGEPSVQLEHPPPQTVEEQVPPRSEEPEVTTVRRKLLVRRARTNATQGQVLGVDDPSMASFTFSQPSATGGQPADATSATPVESQAINTGRPNRLKKRARTEKDYNPILASLEEQIAAVVAPSSEHPPLKRFKALFDETDPDHPASQMSNSGTGGILDSQVFSQSAPEDRNNVQAITGPSRPPLVIIREEEEESLPASGQDAPRNGVAQMDVDDGSAPSLSQAKPPSKTKGPTSQIHVEPFDSTQLTKWASSKGGAAPGQPDTDAAFLQALASTKKGKRKEDDFDREFNNLRISKPERDRDAEEWRVLADFGDDSNIRGNFMVIVEMEVPERSKDSSRETSVVQNRGPDFKKFKKTMAWQRPSVELVADDGNDYGMGSAYWKGSQNQHQSQGAANGDVAPVAQQGFLQPSQTQNRGFLQPKAGPSSQVPKPRSRSQAQTQMQTQTQSKAVKTETQQVPRRGRSRPLQVIEEDENSEETRTRASKSARAMTSAKAKNGKSQPLFLSDEEDIGSNTKESQIEVLSDDEVNFDLDDEVEMSDSEPAAPTLRSTAQSTEEAGKSKATASPAKRGASTKRRAAALMDDDSDTGMAFKGFGARKRTKAK